MWCVRGRLGLSIPCSGDGIAGRLAGFPCDQVTIAVLAVPCSGRQPRATRRPRRGGTRRRGGVRPVCATRAAGTGGKRDHQPHEIRRGAKGGACPLAAHRGPPRSDRSTRGSRDVGVVGDGCRHGRSDARERGWAGEDLRSAAVKTLVERSGLGGAWDHRPTVCCAPEETWGTAWVSEARMQRSPGSPGRGTGAPDGTVIPTSGRPRTVSTHRRVHGGCGGRAVLPGGGALGPQPSASATSERPFGQRGARTGSGAVRPAPGRGHQRVELHRMPRALSLSIDSSDSGRRGGCEAGGIATARVAG